MEDFYRILAKYIKDSKSSEKKRLSSTQQIVKAQSLIIMNNIKDESLILSEQGKVYYAQSLPYALNAAIATYNLYHATTNAIKNVGKSDLIFVYISVMHVCVQRDELKLWDFDVDSIVLLLLFW